MSSTRRYKAAILGVFFVRQETPNVHKLLVNVFFKREKCHSEALGIYRYLHAISLLRNRPTDQHSIHPIQLGMCFNHPPDKSGATSVLLHVPHTNHRTREGK